MKHCKRKKMKVMKNCFLQTKIKNCKIIEILQKKKMKVLKKNKCAFCKKKNKELQNNWNIAKEKKWKYWEKKLLFANKNKELQNNLNIAK